MEKSLDLSVSDLFRDAMEKSVTLEMRCPEDWDANAAIKEQFTQERRNLTKTYDAERPDRIAAKSKELIDKAGAKTFEHPTPFGTDRFDKTRIHNEAVRQVDSAHEAQLIKLNDQEVQAYADLVDQIQNREQQRGAVRDRARTDFTRATDRRTGQDRRGPSRS